LALLLLIASSASSITLFALLGDVLMCRLAVNMNLLAVRKMVKLCKGFKKLEVFVHVSTAYANCERQYIEEMIYPPPVEPQKLIDAME